MDCRMGVSEKEIDRFENLCRIRLPLQYREFLLSCGGAHCRKKAPRFAVNGCTLKSDCVQSFFGFCDENKYSLTYWYTLTRRSLRFTGMFPIGVAASGCIILLSRRNEVLLWDDSASLRSSGGVRRKYKLAQGFGAFLDMLS